MPDGEWTAGNAAHRQQNQLVWVVRPMRKIVMLATSFEMSTRLATGLATKETGSSLLGDVSHRRSVFWMVDIMVVVGRLSRTDSSIIEEESQTRETASHMNPATIASIMLCIALAHFRAGTMLQLGSKDFDPWLGSVLVTPILPDLLHDGVASWPNRSSFSFSAPSQFFVLASLEV
jgi:hypothetical protein